MQTYHDVMLVTQWLFTTETLVLHLVAGNVNKDICNFICGETRKIIVHELFNCMMVFKLNHVSKRFTRTTRGHWNIWLQHYHLVLNYLANWWLELAYGKWEVIVFINELLITGKDKAVCCLVRTFLLAVNHGHDTEEHNMLEIDQISSMGAAVY